MVRFYFILFLLLSGINIYSQNISKRLRVSSGGNVQFIFNTFFDYNNGVTYTDWTKLSIYFTDTTDLGVQNFVLNWKLDVRALDTDIRGISNNLPLETIELEVITADAGPLYLVGQIALTDFDQSLATAGPQTDLAAPVPTDVFITYHCGKSLLAPNNLLGKSSDYYTVNLVFTLAEE